MYNPYDFYFKKAKKQGYKARSIFKIEEIDQKYKIFSKDTKKIMDIGCSPGSWSQYALTRLEGIGVSAEVFGFDINHTDFTMDGFHFFKEDVTDFERINSILEEQGVKEFDVIMSDMAANTIGQKDIDAIRTLSLVEESLPLYKNFLKSGGKFIIKVFMGPGFDELVSEVKKHFGGKRMKILKPQASRKESKETYIIRY